MSAKTNDKGGVPIKHSKSKEEKQAAYLAKRARRAAQLEAKKAEAAKAEPTQEQAAQALVDKLTAEQAANENKTPEVHPAIERAAGAIEAAKSDELTALETELAALEATKPEGMSNKQWKNARWAIKTKLAALVAAKLKEAMKLDQPEDGPTAEVSPDLPEGNKVEPKGADFVSSVNAEYDSTGEALAKEAKVATLNGKAFDSGKPILDGSENDESVIVGEDLVKHGSFAAIEAAEKEEAAKNDPAATEEPAAPVEEPAAEEPAPEPAVEEPQAAVEAVVESPKPELVVDNTPHTTAERNERIDAAMKFYGKAFTAERSSLLVEAHRFLMMAVKAEAEKKSTVEMALRQALRKENEAFAISATMAKAA